MDVFPALRSISGPCLYFSPTLLTLSPVSSKSGRWSAIMPGTACKHLGPQTDWQFPPALISFQPSTIHVCSVGAAIRLKKKNILLFKIREVTLKTSHAKESFNSLPNIIFLFVYMGHLKLLKVLSHLYNCSLPSLFLRTIKKVFNASSGLNRHWFETNVRMGI